LTKIKSRGINLKVDPDFGSQTTLGYDPTAIGTGRPYHIQRMSCKASPGFAGQRIERIRALATLNLVRVKPKKKKKGLITSSV
jgi:hypothetical protein